MDKNLNQCNSYTSEREILDPSIKVIEKKSDEKNLPTDKNKIKNQPNNLTTDDNTELKSNLKESNIFENIESDRNKQNDLDPNIKFIKEKSNNQNLFTDKNKILEIKENNLQVDLIDKAKLKDNINANEILETNENENWKQMKMKIRF